MSRVRRPKIETVAFWQCDLQAEFLAHAFQPQSVLFVAKMLAKAAHLISIPLVVSELESKGPTVPEVSAAWETPPAVVVRRTSLSACTPEALAALQGRKSVVLYGLEAHAAVLQTCLDLIAQGLDVYLLVDGISCQQSLARSTALQRMRQAGAMFETYGSILTGLIDNQLMTYYDISMILIKVRPIDPMPSL